MFRGGKSWLAMASYFVEQETGVRFRLYSGIMLQCIIYCLFAPYIQKQRPQLFNFSASTHICLDFPMLFPLSTFLCELPFMSNSTMLPFTSFASPDVWNAVGGSDEWVRYQFKCVDELCPWGYQVYEVYTMQGCTSNHQATGEFVRALLSSFKLV